MKFMNEWEIANAVDKYARHDVLGPAAAFLNAFKNEVNLHSDGWPHWSAPVKSAHRLMELFDEPHGATFAKLRKAVSPIKAFYTRRGYKAGMNYPEGII